MQATIDKKFIRLSFPYNKALVAHCQNMAMRFSKVTHAWSTPNNYMNRRCLNQCFPGILPPEPPREVKELVIPSYLMDHQKRGLRIASRHDRFAYWHDTGTGKSCLGLEIFRYHKVKTLIICPLSLIEGAWMEEIRNRYPDIDAANLWAAKKRSTGTLNKALEKDMCLINYESFRTIDKKLAAANFDMVILDESARIRTFKKGSTADKVIEFCDNTKYVYELSGVPAPNSMLEYWTQIRILNPLLWGKSFYKFRTKYFYPSGYGGYTFLVKSEYEEKLINDIKKVAEYINKKDVLDLPGRTESMRIFQLSTEERKHYKNIKNDLMTILDEGETITSPSAVTAIQKLRQISSGFLLKEDDIYEIGSSKLNELLMLLEDLNSQQVIIWTEFRHEATQIAKKLTKLKKTHGILNGTISENDKQISIKEFKSSNLQYIIAHPRSVGHGLTLTCCSDAIYYSGSYSYEAWYQSRDRIYRYGQENKCSYYSLLADKTLDLIVHGAVRKKNKASLAILDYLKRDSK